MAQGVNKAILIGNLGADPEVRNTQSGKQVTTFRIATSEKWTDQGGQQQERTEWHRIVAWGKLAEICGQYLAKGRRVYVEGRIQTRTYDKDGQTHYATEINAQTVQFLDSGQGDNEGSKPRTQREVNNQRDNQAKRQPPNDEDIPF